MLRYFLLIVQSIIEDVMFGSIGCCLHEARRQKSISEVGIPAVCILDPDGDIASQLLASG
jgi:hypothetical protein